MANLVPEVHVLGRNVDSLNCRIHHIFINIFRHTLFLILEISQKWTVLFCRICFVLTTIVLNFKLAYPKTKVLMVFWRQGPIVTGCDNWWWDNWACSLFWIHMLRGELEIWFRYIQVWSSFGGLCWSYLIPARGHMKKGGELCRSKLGRADVMMETFKYDLTFLYMLYTYVQECWTVDIGWQYVLLLLNWLFLPFNTSQQFFSSDQVTFNSFCTNVKIGIVCLGWHPYIFFIHKWMLLICECF